MFKPVEAFKLPTGMSSLTVRDAHDDEAATLRSEANSLATVTRRPTRADETGSRLFVLDCDGAVGWVLASVMVAYEDEGRYDTPSAIFHGTTPPDALIVRASG